MRLPAVRPHQDGEPLTSYGEQDNGASVSLKPSESFELRLAENPTTGHRWHLAEWDHSILEVTRTEFHPPATPLAGAGGEHVWEFVARAPGTLSLRLAYRRGGSASPAKVFSLLVSVTSESSA
jgi:predicted secreted protein